jgi:hypothetical protein
MSRFNILLLTCFIGMVTGCSGVAKQGEAESPEPAPTLNAVFDMSGENSQSQETEPIDDLMGIESVLVTAEPQVEALVLTPLPTLTPVSTITMRIDKIYGDTLNANWSLDNSRDVSYKLEDDYFVYDGNYSLAYSPKVEYAELIFSVNESSDEIYLRDDVLAVRFWLYSGDDYIATDDFAVSVVGSNAFPYWVVGDDSVTVQDNNPVFPETRLYYLNVDKDISPNTWFQVELWLNDLISEPMYKYVTGIVLKNDVDFLRRVSIDNLELVIREN